MQKQEKVVLEGGVKVSAQLFNDSFAEITFYGDFKCGNRRLKGLPFLRLLAEQFDEHSGIDVTDEYCMFIPYLKHSQAFRGFLQNQVIPSAFRDPLIASNVFLKCALHDYGRTLGSYSPTKALVNQAKSTVNRLDPTKRASWQTARDVLEVLDVAPWTDLEFVAITA